LKKTYQSKHVQIETSSEREFESSTVLTWFISFESNPAIKNKTFSQIIPPILFPQRSRPTDLMNSDVGSNSPLPRRPNSI